MKLIKWSFRELEISMVKIDGELLCTSAALCSALGMTADHLRKVVQRNKAQLHPQPVMNRHESNECVTNRHALQNFLRAHKEEFGLKIVKGSMVLWPLREALKVAYLARTDISWEFINASIDLVERNTKTNTVSREEFEALECRYLAQSQYYAEQSQRFEEQSQRLDSLERIVWGSKEALQTAASAAGSMLAAQRGTKIVRGMN